MTEDQSKWQIWPLLMAFGFVCIQQPKTMFEFVSCVGAITALTFSISCVLCRRRP